MTFGDFRVYRRIYDLFELGIDESRSVNDGEFHEGDPETRDFVADLNSHSGVVGLIRRARPEQIGRAEIVRARGMS